MNLDDEEIRRTAGHLALVAGLLTIVLAPALLLLRTPLAEVRLDDFTVVAIDLVLGLVLVVASRWTARNLLTAVVLGFVASMTLLFLGETAGLIGGAFGLAGALLGILLLTRDLLT